MTVREGDEMETEPAPVTTSTTPASSGGEFFFPFKQLPSVNWTEGMRAFGSRRSHGARAHAGCDLYFPVSTTIHAITVGTVTRGPYEFYEGTYALEVDHGAFLARYGEIQKSALVRQGDCVSAGQPIAKVGKLNSITNSMLHLELYDKSATGDLTVRNNQTKRTAKGVPFMRRRDLIDPTAKCGRITGQADRLRSPGLPEISRWSKRSEDHRNATSFVISRIIVVDGIPT